ncbi:hypothetical protein L7P61_00950 [Aeromonas veronii bv. sobria]|uniref:Uncharacterized protein n=1 Tax=Aeromonas veronii TaxID=654 RepID=A0ABY3MKF6_AERVE|nr:hypothetical protein [Aeromonas veronii]RDU89586.1 hypothetical protein CGZ72_00950 [Aeromonas veronii]RDU91267.1 hypothetical protein CGZ76_00795 [Aeromonas veronii]TEY49365.1 hypothetical protein CIG14_14710 [Aeromonas veronii]TEY74934.1 hypothetical protein CIG16_17165 [Aeromonas veronii]TYD43873.1 hypothetical protein CJF24_12765 [Aeromonas veronii]
MNLFKRFLELVPGTDPLLVGTVTAVGTTTTTLNTLAGGTVTVRGTGVAIGKKAFYRGGALAGEAPDLPTYEIEV